MSNRRSGHWHIFIYKAMLGLLPAYICSLITRRNVGSYSLRSNDHLLLFVPFARTELGKRAFVYSAPSAWNYLQKDLKLSELISLNAFKSRLRTLESILCNCFSLCVCNCIVCLKLFCCFLARTPLKKRFLISMGLSWLNKGKINKYSFT